MLTKSRKRTNSPVACRIGLQTLVVAFLCVVSLAGPAKSGAQDPVRLGYSPPPQEISQYFRGNLGPENGRALAFGYARYLHLMGEKPLPEIAATEGAQVYRVLVETRPYNIPVVVRFSILPDGTGEVASKISHSPRFADRLTTNKTVRASRVQVEQFLKLLARWDFWSLPVLEQIDPSRVRMGGVGWMLEGERHGSYHVVCREARDLASFDEPLAFLVNLSQLDLASTTTPPSDGKPR